MTPLSSHGWRIALLTASADVVRVFHHVLSQRGHTLAALVLPVGVDGTRARHPSAWAPMLETIQAAPPGTDVLIAGERGRLEPLLASARPDLILCFFFPWRVPPEALAQAPLGAINVHPSRLPRHRGPNPLGWTLRNGEPEVGLTFHRMDAQFDTGPLLVQGSRPVDEADAPEDIVRKVMELAMELLPEALSRVQWRDEGESQSQPEASYAGLFEDAYRELDWNAPARELHLRVRACAVAAWRGTPRVAFASIEGWRVQVRGTRLPQGGEEPGGPEGTPPGTVLAREGEALLVQCADGPLWVLPGPVGPD